MYLKDKTLQINIRLSEKDKEKLDFLCNEFELCRTDMILDLISHCYYSQISHNKEVNNDK